MKCKIALSSLNITAQTLCPLKRDFLKGLNDEHKETIQRAKTSGFSTLNITSYDAD